MAYNALDVARYVIKYGNDRDYGVSNLKLQKILYFIQTYFLIQTNSPCFKEPIEAWDFGPIVPAVYKQYKMYASAIFQLWNPIFLSMVMTSGNRNASDSTKSTSKMKIKSSLIKLSINSQNIPQQIL